MRRQTLALTVATAALVGLTVQTAPAAAPPRPAHALAVLSSSTLDDSAGYHDGAFGYPGSPAYFSGGHYWYENYAAPDQYGTAVSVGGKVLAPAVKGRRIVSTIYSTDRQRSSTIRSATFPAGYDESSTPVVGKDGSYYVLVSRTNTKESKGFVVAKLRQYSPALALTKVIDVRSDVVEGGLRRVDASAPSLLVSGTTVIAHLGRERFRSSDGLHHQSNATLRFNLTAGGVKETAGPYASHSFAQQVRASGNDVVYADHGDAYPRFMQLGIAKDQLGVTGDQADVSAWSVLNLRGAVGDNYTGATLNDLEVDGDRALVAGVTNPQNRTLGGVRGNGKRLVPNAYLVSSSTATKKFTYRWLTTYSPTSSVTRVGQPRIVPVGEHLYAVIFTVTRGSAFATHYRLVDRAGTVLAKTAWQGKNLEPLSDPVLVGEQIYWVAGPRTYSGAAKGAHYLVGLDVVVPKKPQLLTR